MSEILVIDDDSESRRIIAEVLEREGYMVSNASSGEAARRMIEEGDFDLVISDLVMPDVDGMEILRTAGEKEFPPEVVILTGFGSVESAVEAMKKGASQYLNKPINIKELREVARKELEKRNLRQENLRLKRQVGEKFGFERIIGKSPAMEAVFEKVRQIAPTSATVLLTGESGTGKELVARAIHANSPRKNRPFMAFNCGALTETLIESELFGHERGAFTGAIRDRKGYFELASGGTLLLDEVGDMPLPTQVKLLRVLETREFFRVGGTKPIEVDVRVVASTNRNLDEAIAEGRFREDLYYRLKVLIVELPPLRERRDDIPRLFAAFLEEFNERHSKSVAGADKEAMAALVSYDWPGNVRELRNLVENLVITTRSDEIGIIDLPREISKRRLSGGAVIFPENMTMAEIEREVISETLRRTRGNKTNAARILGIGLRTLHRKVKKIPADEG